MLDMRSARLLCKGKLMKQSQYARGVLCSIGWGTNVGWGICLFFTDAMSGSVLSTRIGWLASLLVSSATFLAVFLLPSTRLMMRIGTRTGARGRMAMQKQPRQGVAVGNVWYVDQGVSRSIAWLVWSAAAVVCIGSLLFCYVPSQHVAVRVIAITLTAVANVILNVSWGLSASVLDIDTIERSAAFVAAPMVVCYALGALLAPQVSGALVSFLPLVSAAIMHGFWKAEEALPGRGVDEPAPQDAAAPSDRVDGGSEAKDAEWQQRRKRLGQKGIGIAASAACISLLWTVERMSWGGESSSLAYNMAAILGIVLAGVVVTLYTRFASHVDLSNLQRVILPGMIICYACTTILTYVGSLVSYSLSMTIQTFLDLAVWVLMAELAQQDRDHAIEIIASGRFFIQVGLLAGCIVSLIAGSALDGAREAQASVELFLLAAMSVAIMYSIGASSSESQAQASSDAASAGTSRDWESSLNEFADTYSLTAREREVLRYIARGHTQAYIRNEMGISKNTVDTHARHIYQKCDVHSKEELIVLIEQQSGSPGSPIETERRQG